MTHTSYGTIIGSVDLGGMIETEGAVMLGNEPGAAGLLLAGMHEVEADFVCVQLGGELKTGDTMSAVFIMRPHIAGLIAGGLCKASQQLPLSSMLEFMSGSAQGSFEEGSS